MFEDFETSVKLTIGNITEDLADKALQALYAVHSAYVCHSFLGATNFLLVTRGNGEQKVVVTDFEHARIAWRSPSLSRHDLLKELANGWEIFYTEMVSATLFFFQSTRSTPNAAPGSVHWTHELTHER